MIHSGFRIALKELVRVHLPWKRAGPSQGQELTPISHAQCRGGWE